MPRSTVIRRSTGGFRRRPEPVRARQLRTDYVLASDGLTVVNAGVFWPTTSDPYASLMTASDHRLVWVDVR